MPSSTVTTVSSAPRSPAANSAFAGSVSASIVPLSSMITVAVRAPATGPERVSVKTASDPSST